MHELTVTRWRRYGHDRLYVSDDGDNRVGWLDLLTGALHLDQPGLSAELDRALLSHFGVQAAVAPTPAPTPRPSIPVQPMAKPAPWEDLAARIPGQEPRQVALALRREAPVRTAVARMFGVHTEERAWRIGADGEQKVASQLAKLVRRDPRWRSLHGIPVGSRGSDIDHLVIGPGGVFSLNAKHHPGKKLWVGGDAFLVDGQRQPYVRNSRFEAERASRLLSAAVGFAVPVRGVVVPVGADDLTVKQQPRDVHVVSRRRVAQWLAELPAVVRPELVEALFAAVRRSTTWVR